MLFAFPATGPPSWLLGICLSLQRFPDGLFARAMVKVLYLLDNGRLLRVVVDIDVRCGMI